MRECKLVADLWPLYLDGELSEESKEFVEEHLKKCEDCQKLSKTNHEVEISQLLQPVEPSINSPEKFLLKLKSRVQTVIAGVLVGILIISGGTWYYGKWSTQQAIQRQYQEEYENYQESLLALDQISPSSDQLLEKLGVSFYLKEAQQSDDRLNIEYELTWRRDSPVEWIMEDRNMRNHLFQGKLLIDEKTGKPLQLRSGSGGSDRSGFTRRIEADAGNKEIEKAKLKTKPLFAFMEAPDFTFKYNYEGGEQSIDVNKSFVFQDVEFVIDSLELSDEEFKVNYRQLTPATEVGVYQLQFAFDDRLGNEWSSDGVELNVQNPKESTMRAINSPSKNWELKLRQVVLVIPGIEADIAVGEGR